MVQLTFAESVIRYVFLYCVFPIAIFVLTPIRLIVDFFTMSNPDYFEPWAWSTEQEPEAAKRKHSKKVLSIQEQVRNWNKEGRKGVMCTGRPGWKTFNLKNLNKKSMTKINMDLEDIVLIDEEAKVLMVEPGVKMGTLTTKILPTGWTIPVVPETESLTVGGCVCGGGIETSSHKYGLFAEGSCVAYEVVLADGSLIKCSKDDHSDIFYTLPCSHGTIGLLTAVYFKLMPASKFVKIEYIPTKSISEAQQLLDPEEKPDFIEGIAYGLNKFVIMYGTMVNEAAADKIQSFSRWYDPWFYKHAESVLSRPNERHIEYVPLRDYYHRHQRSLFWEAEITLPYGNHPLFRYLLGWILPVNVQLMKLITPSFFVDYFSSKNHVLQDIVVPMQKLEEIIAFSHKEVKVYPLWLCPLKIFNNPTIVHPSGRPDGKYIDIGIYGLTPKVKEYDLEETTKRFEQFALENDGAQGLYAETFLSKSQFSEMFDLTLYQKVREKYGCVDAFPHVYDKICRAARVS